MRDAQIERGIREKQSTGLSLRGLEDATGVSASTLSRFLNYKGNLSARCRERVICYLTGSPTPARCPVATRRIAVGGKVFMVTIEEVKTQ